jgi:hypothetical protein
MIMMAVVVFIAGFPFTDRTVFPNNEACRYYVGLPARKTSPLQGLLPTGATQSCEYKSNSCLGTRTADNSTSVTDVKLTHQQMHFY